jgi:hypothetical protein
LYISFSHLSRDFFTNSARLSRNESLVEEMPFLYKLLFAKAMEKGMEDLETQNNDADDGGLADLPIIDEATPVTSSTSSLDEAIVPKDPVWLTQRNVSEYDGYALAKSKDPLVRKRLRAETVRQLLEPLFPSQPDVFAG